MNSRVFYTYTLSNYVLPSFVNVTLSELAKNLEDMRSNRLSPVEGQEHILAVTTLYGAVCWYYHFEDVLTAAVFLQHVATLQQEANHE